MLIAGLLVLGSCSKDDDAEALGGSQSSIGSVDNTFNVSGIPGVGSVSAKVTELKDGVSSITLTANITDAAALAALSAISGSAVAGTSFSRTSKYKMTTEGIESVYPEGNLILVKYNAKVGDTWSLNLKSSTIVRTVASVSTTDDFSWNGLMVKTINVDETGRGIPGVTKIKNILNHKFGLVAVVLYLEDGSTARINVVSKKTN